MSPIPVPFLSLCYLYAGLLAATGLVVWGGRMHAGQVGWRRGGWRTPLQALGWGGLLAVVGLAWLRFLLHTGRYLPIPVLPSVQDWMMLILCAPIVEELCFRGAVFGSLQRHWSLFWAVILSAACSVVFLPMHGLLALVFINSIGYALAFRLSGSLLSPMLAHALVATVLVLGRRFPACVADVSPRSLLAAAGIAILVILFGLIPRKPNAA